MNLPQIRVQWTDTGQPSNYTVQIYREKSMFVNTAVLIKKDITTVKEVTFGSLGIYTFFLYHYFIHFKQNDWPSKKNEVQQKEVDWNSAGEP